MTSDAIEKPADTHAFQAEVSRLLHMMVHSVYSNRDIFLRELISNAADACEKLRWMALADPGLLSSDAPLGITIIADKAARTLCVIDNGIGMGRQELVDNLGTIARSGTRAFLDEASDAPDRARLIGQFGVGFYSAFMVASEVEVVSRKAGSDEAWAWTSDGKGTFSVAQATLDSVPTHGTRVLLKLSPESETYAETTTIERIVEEYSAHVPVPIRLADSSEAEARALTDGSALWVKPKSSVTKDEYKDFYGTVSGQWDEPALTVHYKAEGRLEYSVLLFVPSMKPFDLFDPSRKGRIKLYVRRIFISDDVDILPAWARFVRGVIDSEDLPLNLSREMLQTNPMLDSIRKAVTSRTLSELAKLAENEPETFEKIWEAFGPVIKEGLYEDFERRDDLFKIVRFKTTQSADRWRGLAEIVKDLKENQTRIFYVLADTPQRAAASPHLEGFRARDIEVLLLTDPVDAFWVRTALGFNGKPFQSVTQGAADLDAIPPVTKTDEPAAPTDGDPSAGLIAYLKQRLGDRVSDVRASKRLAESAACLVAPDVGPDRAYEKIVSRHEGGSPLQKPVLEINPGHTLLKGMSRGLANGGAAALSDDGILDDAAHLVLAQARVMDGEVPEDTADFARRLSRVMERLFV